MLDFKDMDLETITHVIQSALTPIFLLTAIAGLLGVFTTRLARISDQATALSAVVQETRADADILAYRLDRLRLRSLALDLAVILGAMAGACTCCTVLTLFLGALRAKATATILFIFFGAAVCFTIGALVSFLVEMLYAGQSVREQVARRVVRLQDHENQQENEDLRENTLTPRVG